jgi:hypothetical protein
LSTGLENERADQAAAQPPKGLAKEKAEWLKPGLMGRVKFLKREEKLRYELPYRRNTPWVPVPAYIASGGAKKQFSSSSVGCRQMWKLPSPEGMTTSYGTK